MVPTVWTTSWFTHPPTGGFWFCPHLPDNCPCSEHSAVAARTHHCPQSFLPAESLLVKLIVRSISRYKVSLLWKIHYRLCAEATLDLRGYQAYLSPTHTHKSYAVYHQTNLPWSELLSHKTLKSDRGWKEMWEVKLWFYSENRSRHSSRWVERLWH